jgi:LysR family transcriptional regulator for metE and metH
LKAFGAGHPRVDVRICAEETRRPAEALLEGRLDLALISSPVRDRRLLARPLFQDEFVVVMPPGHPLAKRPYVRPEDFTDQNLFIYASPEENRALQQVLIPAGFPPRQVTQVQLTEAMLELVKAGHGLAVVAYWTVAPRVKRGALRARRFTRAGLFRRWQSVRLRNGPAPGYLLAFEDLLARSCLAALGAPARTPRTPARDAKGAPGR